MIILFEIEIPGTNSKYYDTLEYLNPINSILILKPMANMQNFIMYWIKGIELKYIKQRKPEAELIGGCSFPDFQVKTHFRWLTET